MDMPSSPLSSPPLSQAKAEMSPDPPTFQYRPPRALPFELSQQVLTYFEETLYTQALTLLTSLVSSACASVDPSTPAFVPSPTYLGLVATMAVHPTLTTRSSSQEKLDQANAALRLLRLIHAVIGPVGADFETGFAFRKFGFVNSRLSGAPARHSDGDAEDIAMQEGGAENLDTPFSGSGSLWCRAEDLWQVVGWAFNCSCLTGMHTQRWQRWNLWIDFMLQVLEDDWALRDKQEEWDRSLLWHYIDHHASVGQGRNRRILRAIFADGSTKSVNEFREVFRNELKEPTSDAEKIKKREVDVNIDQDIYGDYLMRDEDDVSEEDEGTGLKPKRTRDPSTRRVTPRQSSSSLRGEYANGEAESSSSPLGGVDSLSLRTRLLQLLSSVAWRLPKMFTPLDELYTLYVEFIRPLPLATFQLIISPSVLSSFSQDAHCALCEVLLQRMLEPAAPTVRGKQNLTQARMEKHYLPYAANTAGYVENAKVSLLLETLLRCLAMSGNLANRLVLKDALDKGIKARADKAFNESRKGASTRKGEGAARSWLVESGERMMDVMQWLD